MNKKFSTLMACAMLAGSMSAYSQTSHGVTGKWGNPSETRYRTQNTAVTAPGASVERNTAVSDYQAVRTDAFIYIKVRTGISGWVIIGERLLSLIH